ncbi:gliding motility-associated C-terminal domain-containing protein [Aquimarina sp. ERC-38]|uniref:gliding motility-associated C-terminal domain-containing protein n=1 Tax=Aquimarina sp. ERC-38 TaxID=2949996 RepID=UPI002245580C|nr:gliding motility-associated C-terminal domain-containing protein [Aquimarina sp. ERC-38]UZO80729.1 gliding motility-associated C-terminal domain-containing protein [Aquimarina sp. ERC-38]
MNIILYINLLILSSVSLIGQQAFHNFGPIRIHEMGQVGFHTDVINDGAFNQNLGFTGFYNLDMLTVSGSVRPEFYEMEIDVRGDLFLEVAVGVTNFNTFTNGKVFTPRDDKFVSLDFLQDAFHINADDERHVDGYSTLNGFLNFTFPIGDDFRIRPLRIEDEAAITTSRAAYFFEDPNRPFSFPGTYDTSNYEELLYGISIFEFWDLDGDIATPVTLTWDDNSNIPTLVDNLEDLRVVGWDIKEKRWINLGNANYSGTIDEGEITSDLIIPDNYAILTFGSSSSLLDGDLEIYTAVSPNNDGKNDFFRIDGLGRYPSNKIMVYNRWGVLVYQRDNYHLVQDTDGFKGLSEGRSTINADQELPVGTYYYVLQIEGGKDRAGYIYINK